MRCKKCGRDSRNMEYCTQHDKSQLALPGLEKKKEKWEIEDKEEK